MSRPQFPKGVPVPDWPPSGGPVDLRGWNEDWRVGDLAQCVHDGWLRLSQTAHPRKGDVLRVNAVSEGVAEAGNVWISALGFEGKPAGTFWSCRAFRKLRPVIEPAEAEFSATIRASGRVVQDV